MREGGRVNRRNARKDCRICIVSDRQRVLRNGVINGYMYSTRLGFGYTLETSSHRVLLRGWMEPASTSR